MSIKNKKSHLNQKKTWTSLPSKKKKKKIRDRQRPGGKKKGVKKNNEAHVQLHMGIFLLCLKPLY